MGVGDPNLSKFFSKKNEHPASASHATMGASDGAAETARLEAEDREWRRRIRMDAGSEDPFEDAR